MTAKLPKAAGNDGDWAGFREAAVMAYGESMGRPAKRARLADAHYARRLIRRHFPAARGARIVDLGCGDGVLLAVAGEQGYLKVTGVDRSAEELRVAAGRGVHDVYQQDAVVFLAAAAEGSIDVLLTIDLLEHLTRHEALSLSREAHRALSDGGRWLIHVPNGSSPLGGRIRYGDLTHETAYTTSSLSQLLRLGGFSRFSFFEDTPVIRGLGGAVRAVGWGAVRSLLRLYLAVETGNTGRTEVFSQNLLGVAVKGAGSGRASGSR